MLTNLIKGLLLRQKSLDHNLEITCVEPPHGLTIYQVSAQSDVNCRRSYTETKKFTDGQTDGRTPRGITKYDRFSNGRIIKGILIKCLI